MHFMSNARLQSKLGAAGARGGGRPETLKVQIGYEDGWIAEGRAVLPWPDALEKAAWCEDLVRRRLEYLGVEPIEWRFDRVGIDSLAGCTAPRPTYEPNEVELRVKMAKVRLPLLRGTRFASCSIREPMGATAICVRA